MAKLRCEQHGCRRIGMDRANWDPGVEALCDAINAVPGLRTTSSCNGHGETPLRVWVEADFLRAIFPVARPTSRNYDGIRMRCVVEITDLPERPVILLIESVTVGAEAIAEADRYAAAIHTLLANETVCRMFGIGQEKERENERGY